MAGPGFGLRLWHADDAAALHAVLCEEHARLAPWLPAQVADPATTEATAARLTAYAADVHHGRAWRYGIWSDDGRLLGEFDVFARDASVRVAAASADRAEFGYWLRADATGRGVITAAAALLLPFAQAWPACTGVEIRCDPANAASAAVPVRLGFVRRERHEDPPLDIWWRAWS